MLDDLALRPSPGSPWSKLAPLRSAGPGLDRIRAAVVAAPAGSFVIELRSARAPVIHLPTASLGRPRHGRHRPPRSGRLGRRAPAPRAARERGRRPAPRARRRPAPPQVRRAARARRGPRRRDPRASHRSAPLRHGLLRPRPLGGHGARSRDPPRTGAGPRDPVRRPARQHRDPRPRLAARPRRAHGRARRRRYHPAPRGERALPGRGRRSHGPRRRGPWWSGCAASPRARSGRSTSADGGPSNRVIMPAHAPLRCLLGHPPRRAPRRRVLGRSVVVVHHDDNHHDDQHRHGLGRGARIGRRGVGRGARIGRHGRGAGGRRRRGRRGSAAARERAWIARSTAIRARASTSRRAPT